MIGRSAIADGYDYENIVCLHNRDTHCRLRFCRRAVPPIPGLSQWEAHMKDNARIVAAQPERADCTNINEGYIWYYSGIFVFHQIAEYTKDEKWLAVSAKCRSFYRDGYVIGCRKYGVDGWRNFTRGLYYDWTVLHNEVSRNTAVEMARKSRFSQIVHADNVRQWDKNVDVSREVAYSINAWHVARDLWGCGVRRPRSVPGCRLQPPRHLEGLPSRLPERAIPWRTVGEVPAIHVRAHRRGADPCL